jgi:transcriptional regulator with XRE-family HTH domain
MSATNNTSSSTASRTTFARRLRELRVPRGFRTARSLAQALGIDENRYTRYERAEVEPDLGLLVKICEVLALTPNDLLLDQATTAVPQPTTFRVSPGGHSFRSEARPVERTPPRPLQVAEPAPVPASSIAPQSAYPQGFAEAAPTSPFAGAAPLAQITMAATLKRRAVAWQIARLVGAHGVDDSNEPHPAAESELGGIQRTSRVFAQIERDPFGFVTAIAQSDRVAALPESEQKRITGLIDDLIVAVEMAAQIASKPPL